MDCLNLGRGGATAALATLAVSSLGWTGSAAYATSGILHTTNVVLLEEAPASVRADRRVSNTDAHLFTERESFTLTNDLPVGLTRGGVFEPGVDLANGLIPAGTEITVHFLHWDFPSQPETSRVVDGSVLFGEGRMIAGVISTNEGLDSTDALLGAPGVEYPVDDFSRRVELDPELAGREGQDRVTINPEMSRLEFHLELGDRWLDQMRIITIERPAVVPTPAGLAAVGALGLIGLRRRR